MKKAVMYGGGNIGRGFIGTLFSSSGYEVAFINRSEATIAQLNERREYPVRHVTNQSVEEETVTNVCGINGNDTAAVAEAIAQCDIMATSVGAKVLKAIAPNIAAGIRRRWEINDKPLNIIICENLNDANKVLEELLTAELTEDEKKSFYETVGLVEASVGRMVPVQTDEMKDGDPLRICTERYGFLPVDKAAFKGEVPEIYNMIPFEPFDFYVKRKLYIHNMGHSVCAYLGGYNGRKYIYQAINDPDILNISENAMLESAMALSKEYSVDLSSILLHMTDLLERFRNVLLKDTCERVGGDPSRKLGHADRLIGSGLLCIKHGISPAYIAAGAAAAVCRYLKEEGTELTKEAAENVLETVSGLDIDSEYAKLILGYFKLFAEGEPLDVIRRKAQDTKYLSLNNVI